ncbi:ketopantoate reductase family protein [Thalassomonas haliotis]|uniref:2-dehydropantoate 2-reductase n=1 Tax=Thalassomonas haliotis TaxID=485448 RepID=A0ABY7VKI6_9GAMM|nr:2-dehydropantoate 2-reductase [Thalassomonas haliotis]WDE13927.1 2-dehydropantoate 2-reductase [Thalassomonas haliotis]
MRIVFVGCGAVGGYFGGRLLQSGEDVSFVARKRQFEVLKQQGLTINSIAGDAKLSDIQVMQAPDGDFKADIIFVTVKTFQLSGALPAIKSLLAPHTRVIPLLNGVSAAKKLMDGGIAKKHILGGLAKIIAKVSEPGVISHTGATPHITLGLFKDSEPSEQNLLNALAQKLKNAGISTGISRNIELALWRKYLFVAAWGALACVAGVSIGPLRENPGTRAVLIKLIQEYRAIANSLGVEINQQIVDETLTFIDQLPGHSETSMQRDIASHSAGEFDALVTDALNLAREQGIDVPRLSFCHALLSLQISAFAE